MLEGDCTIQPRALVRRNGTPLAGDAWQPSEETTMKPCLRNASLLLLIGMSVTQAQSIGRTIELGKSEAAGDFEKGTERVIVVNLSADGTLEVAGNTIELEVFDDILEREAVLAGMDWAEDRFLSRLRVILRVDRRCTWQHLRNVLGASEDNGIQHLLLTALQTDGFEGVLPALQTSLSGEHRVVDLWLDEGQPMFAIDGGTLTDGEEESPVASLRALLQAEVEANAVSSVALRCAQDVPFEQALAAIDACLSAGVAIACGGD